MLLIYFYRLGKSHCANNMNGNTSNKWILNLGKNSCLSRSFSDNVLDYNTITINIFVRKDILKC